MLKRCFGGVEAKQIATAQSCLAKSVYPARQRPYFALYPHSFVGTERCRKFDIRTAQKVLLDKFVTLNKKAARGIAGGLVIDWNLDNVDHVVGR